MPVTHRNFAGGLNSTAGHLGLEDNDASDLQNIDFDKFGSLVKRSGYSALNTSAITNSPDIDGLHWYEAVITGAQTRFLMTVADGKLWKMDDLDGTWDDVTGALTITAGNKCDFENYLNKVYIANGVNLPFEYAGSGNGAAMTVPTGLTTAKFIKLFNNFLFLLNVTVSGTVHGSRLYWYDIKSASSISDLSFIEIAKDDGQEITGARVLSDRLVVFKTRSIYNVFFTGDADIPFILPGGGKSNSSVGCMAPFSIQSLENGLVFLSNDGFYFYDGNNSYKISEKITTTLLSYNTGRFNQATSLVQNTKNRYWCALPDTGQTENDKVLVFDFFHKAWSVYDGINASAMATVYVEGKQERPYFGDYAGFVYRGDTGLNDSPLNVATAIDAYYKTNWKHYDDIVDQKDVPHVYIYFQHTNAVMTFSYSYDFEDIAQYSNTFSLATGSDTYGSGLYGTATYAGMGGGIRRRDLAGRGRVVRFEFSNDVLGEAFRIDGLGVLASLETNV